MNKKLVKGRNTWKNECIYKNLSLIHASVVNRHEPEYHDYM